MANNKQANKRIRQNVLARDRNKQAVSVMRSSVKKVLTAESEEVAKTHLAEAMKRVDKAAKDHVIHANAAARKKGQLSRAAGIK
jgi:small subunit ribosomal protein S20